jgi:hypothetical protein
MPINAHYRELGSDEYRVKRVSWYGKNTFLRIAELYFAVEYRPKTRVMVFVLKGEMR